MQFWRSGPVQEEMRPVFLPETCSACTLNSVSKRDGKWKSPLIPREQPAGIRKLLWMSGETGYMEFLNMNPVCTAFNGSPRLRPRDGYIHLQPPWLCCLKRKNL